MMIIIAHSPTGYMYAGLAALIFTLISLSSSLILFIRNYKNVSYPLLRILGSILLNLLLFILIFLSVYMLFDTSFSISIILLFTGMITLMLLTSLKIWRRKNGNISKLILILLVNFNIHFLLFIITSIHIMSMSLND
jgi:hypothetical protein